MRLLFIRHGMPNYELDRLTDVGVKEAEALAEFSPNLQVGTCFVSPLGRAQETASFTLKKLGLTAETKDWLQEFPVRVDVNRSEFLQKAYQDERVEDGSRKIRIPWDMYPGPMMSDPSLWDRNAWRTSEVAKYSNIVEMYDEVTGKFDELLASYGYVRDGDLYRVEKEYEGTLTFFCHYGITSVMLSHLWNVSPFIPLHSTCLVTTSVSEVVSEERQQGTAMFRALRLGDTTHLTLAGLTPSFAARFCEVYSNEEQRH